MHAAVGTPRSVKRDMRAVQFCKRFFKDGLHRADALSRIASVLPLPSAKVRTVIGKGQ